MAHMLAFTLSLVAALSTLYAYGWAHLMPKELDAQTLAFFASGFLAGTCLFLLLPWALCIRLRRKKLAQLQSRLTELRGSPKQAQRLQVLHDTWKSHSALDILSITIYRKVYVLNRGLHNLATRILNRDVITPASEEQKAGLKTKNRNPGSAAPSPSSIARDGAKGRVKAPEHPAPRRASTRRCRMKTSACGDIADPLESAF